MPLSEFSKYRNLYKEPERLTVDEARQRTFFNKLQAERKRLEDEGVRLSQANQFHINRLKEFEDKFGAELEAQRRRVEKLNLRDPSILRSSTNRAAISRLFQLQQRRAALMQRASAEKRANSFKKLFVDRRQFSFGQFNVSPKSVFGTEAWTTVLPNGRRVFRSVPLVVPCIERAVRREVMFAFRHAGRGHRVKHRRGVFSYIGC